MRPLIGIPQCLDDRGRWRPGRDVQYLDRSYACAVEAAGGTPLHAPIQADAEALAGSIDGLLLPGGGDFPPPRPYPGAVDFDLVSDTQRDFDDRLLAVALRRRLPLLAICYGMQLLTIHCGGSLHFDLASDLPNALNHRLPEPGGRHAIDLAAESKLAGILGPSAGPVNSLHHQGVASAGALRVAALAEDGVIEAVEGDAAAFCIGVQWHPEKLDGPHRERLFAAFVAACQS